MENEINQEIINSAVSSLLKMPLVWQKLILERNENIINWIESTVTEANLNSAHIDSLRFGVPDFPSDKYAEALFVSQTGGNATKYFRNKDY